MINCTERTKKENEEIEPIIEQEEVFVEEPISEEIEEELVVTTEDWDQVLENYEEYIEEYITLLKKTKDGDTSVMTEYMQVMEKANKLSEKMKNAGNEMTPKQMKKLMNLQNKLSNAALEMQ